ncbi:energy transducer TonB [Halioglobus pacificus]|uniref:Transporter TonB n=1 Tax=Parahalioglobus pacificus TaxID=930806 RepID=A0A918XJF5_9GAMM|nr:energy transducer TonB [Halioglobus pacificus]GHD35181.1 transporter TonB [Halioglobus pacificus]
MYYIGGERDANARMKVAVALAAALHCALLLGVGFSAQAPGPINATQIEVTLAFNTDSTAPDDATHIAQANQAGSGDESTENQLTPAASAPLVVPQEQQRSQREDRNLSEQAREASLATRSANARRIQADAAGGAVPAETLLGIYPEVDQLTRELATLEAELDEQTRAYSDRPRTRRITSIASRSSDEAAYLLDWRRQVEAVGNQYYPEASLRYGIYGSLRLLVVIRYDGVLEDIRVLSSSGYSVLDDAAVKIVRMAAPFAPFPNELRATTDRLEIIRTWQFQENALSSG